mgnify:CR=1 FL=1
MRYQWTDITQLHHQENDTETPRFYLNKVGDSFLDSRRQDRRQISSGLSRKINEFLTRGLILCNGNKKLDLFQPAIRKNKKAKPIEALQAVIF